VFTTFSLGITVTWVASSSSIIAAIATLVGTVACFPISYSYVFVITAASPTKSAAALCCISGPCFLALSLSSLLNMVETVRV
jgi:hypothetical protein